MEKQSKRLFFAAQITAAWPEQLPPARLVPQETRHMTLAFLGQLALDQLEMLLSQIPLPSSPIGMGGFSLKFLFLPKGQARCIALDTTWLEDPKTLFSFQKAVRDWLEPYGYRQAAFFPHITLACKPFNPEEWQKPFEPIPFFLSALHLYESRGNLNYHPLYSYPLIAPFVECDHTADLAFEIRGKSIQELFVHAQLALFFCFPPLVHYFNSSSPETLDQIIVELNKMIAWADVQRGCPFKAVSFHGTIIQRDLLYWEMIVDV